MCDPMTLAGIAMTGLSTGINYAAQQKVQAARNDALAAERIRQTGFDREAQAVNVGARQRYQGMDKKGARKGQKLGDYFAKQDVPEPSAEVALPLTASNITVNEEAKQRDQATEFTNRTAEALGNMRAFGDLMGTKSLLQARDAGTVGQISGFKQGSSAVLPYELDEANSKGDGLKLFGDILGGVGGLALNKGLSTPGTAAAAPLNTPFKASTTLGDYLGGNSSLALGRAFDRSSVPGYARF